MARVCSISAKNQDAFFVDAILTASGQPRPQEVMHNDYCLVDELDQRCLMIRTPAVSSLALSWLKSPGHLSR